MLTFCLKTAMLTKLEIPIILLQPKILPATINGLNGVLAWITLICMNAGCSEVHLEPTWLQAQDKSNTSLSFLMHYYVS